MTYRELIALIPEDVLDTEAVAYLTCMKEDCRIQGVGIRTSMDGKRTCEIQVNPKAT